jgi:hypothetical protein
MAPNTYFDQLKLIGVCTSLPLMTGKRHNRIRIHVDPNEWPHGRLGQFLGQSEWCRVVSNSQIRQWSELPGLRGEMGHVALRVATL